MAEPEEQDELTEPEVADVPEPDQDAHENEESERLATPDELPDETPEEPEAHGPTQEEWEARHAKADKAFKTYSNAVGRIYEEEANDYLPCPLCSDSPAGFVHPQSVGKFPDEVVGAVMMILGQTSASSVNKDPYSTVCDTCDGWGVVATGSRVPNQEVRNCLDCRGIGYLPTKTEANVPNGVPAFAGGSEEHNYVPAALGPEAPEVESLRLRGYTIIPPMQMSE